MSDFSRLKIIKDRYLKHNISIEHHGDCSIYKADRPFCSCGLLHDLMPLSSSELCEAIYPKYEKDIAAQEGTNYLEDKLKTRRILEEVFGPISVENAHEYFEAERDMLRKVFINSPNALTTFIWSLRRAYNKLSGKKDMYNI